MCLAVSFHGPVVENFSKQLCFQRLNTYGEAHGPGLPLFSITWMITYGEAHKIYGEAHGPEK